MINYISGKMKLIISVILVMVLMIGYFSWQNWCSTPNCTPKHTPSCTPDRDLSDASAGRITISTETTHITEPINKDGTVSYVAYLNNKHSQGVTLENNAFITLLKAQGPGELPEDEKMRAAIYKRLEMSPLAEKGDYFQSLYEYVRNHDLKDPEQIVIPAAESENDASDGQHQPSVESYQENRITAEQYKHAYQNPWTKKEHPEIAAWIIANRKPLDLIVAASKKSKFYCPMVSSSDPPSTIDAHVPACSGILSICKALAVRAMMRFGSGDADAAFVDIMAAKRLGRLVATGPTLIETLIGISCDSLGMYGYQALSTSQKLTPTQARTMLNQLRTLMPMPPIIAPIKAERFLILDVITQMKRQKDAGHQIDGLGVYTKSAGVPCNVDWDVVLRIVNDFYDEMEMPWTKPTFAQRRQAFAKTDELVQSKVDNLSGKNSSKVLLAVKKLLGLNTNEVLADELIVLLYPCVQGASILHDRVTIQRRLSVVSMALAAYYAEMGKYPADLASLCPDYLETIPDDLFIEKPLKYSLSGKGYLLYSVGDNITDDGGRHDYRNGDITVRCTSNVN